MDVLDNAIENWENILAQATDIDPFARRYPLPQLEMRHCPLCDEHENCVGCPVANRVGQTNCEGTPYYAAAAFVRRYNAESRQPDRNPARLRELRLMMVWAITREVEFLRSLREG